MSEHRIEELERQYNNAKSKAHQARLDELAAAKRLHIARCRASGWMGKVVESRCKGFTIVVHDVNFMGNKPWALKGFRHKKDGTVGSVEGRVYIEDVVQ